MSYLEGAIVGQAQTPRSYIIAAQGCRYRHKRQNICPINTGIVSPFSEPSTHITPQTHTNSNISGPSHLSRPPSPPKELHVVQSEKIPKPHPLPLCPSHKKHNVPHYQCLCTRPTLPNHLILSLDPFQDSHHKQNCA